MLLPDVEKAPGEISTVAVVHSAVGVEVDSEADLPAVALVALEAEISAAAEQAEAGDLLNPAKMSPNL
jgi:hypothetical protein